MKKYNDDFERLLLGKVGDRIKQLTNMSDSEFVELLTEINDIYHAKNEDYNDGDKWSNFDICNKIGVETTKGIIVRMTDKFYRVLSLIKKHYKGIDPAVLEEKIEDTLKDLAVYSLIAVLSLKREKERKAKCHS